MSTKPPSLSLEGKCAVITGAATGIGRGIALAFAAAGARVVVNHEPGQPAPQELLDSIATAGGEAIAHAADIGDLGTHAGLLDAAVAHFGRLDILVNNAARKGKKAFLEVTPEIWGDVMNVNLRAPFFLGQAAAQRMIAAGTKGRIINVTSIHEAKPLWRNSVYSASKSGLAMVTASLALELSDHGITVNSLVPGAYNTPMNRGPYASPEILQSVLKHIPLHKIGEPEDIAGAALFLASDLSAYMTGASIRVDGGVSLV